MGYGKKIIIPACHPAEMNGRCRIDLETKNKEEEIVTGVIRCHEEPDNEFGFHVSKERELVLSNGEVDLIIQIFSDSK